MVRGLIRRTVINFIAEMNALPGDEQQCNLTDRFDGKRQLAICLLRNVDADEKVQLVIGFDLTA